MMLLAHHNASVRRSILTSILASLVILFHLFDSLNPAFYAGNRESNTISTKPAPGAEQHAAHRWICSAHPHDDFPAVLRSFQITHSLGSARNTKEALAYQKQIRLIVSLHLFPIRPFLRCGTLPPTPESQAHLRRAPPIVSF